MFKSCLILLWAFVFSSVLSVPAPAHAEIMNSLSSSFTIKINGSPIATVSEGAEDGVQATTGSEAAVFTLKDGRLQSGDWFLGRAVTENRSFLPKKVSWFKSGEDIDNRIQTVTASENGDSYKLDFANARLISRDGNVFADLQEGDEQSSLVLEN